MKIRRDGILETQPISVSSLPLPTGAATEATLNLKLNDSTFTSRINTLGQKIMDNSTPVVISSDQTVIPISDNGNSLTIDGTITANIGSTNGIALDTTLSKLTISQNTALGSNTQTMAGGSVTVLAPTYISGEINPLSLTTSGALRVDNSSTIQSIKYVDSPNMDAFGRLRISNPTNIFDNKMLVDKSPFFWDDQQVSGAGTTSTYVINQSAVNMGVANLTAGLRVRQTFRRFNYHSGKSNLIIMTGILGSPVSGIIRRIGYFDTNNGLYFELSGTTLNVAIRSFTSGAVVNTTINQSSWNLDKLDGTGLSGYTLDTSKDNIFIIDFQWLGAGRVRFGFDFAGTIVYCHQVLNANINIVSYMQMPNLPLRYEISNNGTGPASSLIHICTAINVEGGVENIGYLLSADRGSVPLTTLNNSNLYPLVAIRLKSTSLMATINVQNLTLVCPSNSAYKYALILNPTVTGTALSFTGITNSAIEADVSRTNATTVSSGTVITSGYGQSGGATGSTELSVPTQLTIGSSIANVSDILVFAVARVTGTAEDFYGSITWREVI